MANEYEGLDLNEEIADYEAEEEASSQSAAGGGATTTDGNNNQPDSNQLIGKQYVSVHSAGFRDFLLQPELLSAIRDCAFEHPSEVQHECIPQAILGMDVICQAKSGMGKTAVFVLSTLQQLDLSTVGDVSVLCLCHTRELAFQIQGDYDRFSKYMPRFKSEVFYGGIPIKQNKEALKNAVPHCVVGTPGRILQLVREGDLQLGKLKHFVLDECDTMLESLDMRKDVQRIFKTTPREKQVLFFSATLSQQIRGVCKRFMQDPMEVYVDSESKLTLHGLQQYFVQLEEAQKSRKLSDLLDALEFNQVIIFVRSVRRCEELHKLLQSCNFPSMCMHGRMEMRERLKRYTAFKDFTARIMVATDIFGRGIDIEKVNIVINYDMPSNADQYLHRVGRAGRFGTRGVAISFVTDDSTANGGSPPAPAASSGSAPPLPPPPPPSAQEVLAQVQARFAVKIQELPDSIDTSSYMSA